MSNVKRIPSTPRNIPARYRREYKRLKDELRRMGYICRGSLIKRWLPCGKKTCVCRQDAAKRHGPYYQWTCKIGGKTQTRMLPESLVVLYRMGIVNRRKIDRIIQRMQNVSLLAFDAANIRKNA